MRLLYWTGSTYAFKDVDGPHEEKYAILSHRWFTRGEDILFPDVLAGREDASVKHKKGWTKLDYGIQQAKKDGFEFIWIDTCCIDKTSSAELGEAINSMYRWYQEAAVCYAYLWDVKPPDSPSEGPFCPDEEIIGHNADTQLRDFADSVWFTRGWTLQELIAPQEVYFFSQGWRPVGSRKDRVKEIAATTDIHLDLLARRRMPRQYSIAQRMSWAAKRQTGREEDEAYCLLGLFDVSLPMLYGEGRHAFRKLQLEIISNSTDQSILAWNPAAGRPILPGQLFANSPADFKNCGDVERTLSSTVFSTPYRLDNTGLVGQFRVENSNDGENHLQLNCEADGRPIGLRVAVLLPRGKHHGPSWHTDDDVGSEIPMAVQFDEDYSSRAFPIEKNQDGHMRHVVLLVTLDDWALYSRQYWGPIYMQHHRQDCMADCLPVLLFAAMDPPPMISSGGERAFILKVLVAPGKYERLQVAFSVDRIRLPLTRGSCVPEFDGALIVDSTYSFCRSPVFMHGRMQERFDYKLEAAREEAKLVHDRQQRDWGRRDDNMQAWGRAVTELNARKLHDSDPCKGVGVQVTVKVVRGYFQMPTVQLDVSCLEPPPPPLPPTRAPPPPPAKSSLRQFWDWTQS